MNKRTFIFAVIISTIFGFLTLASGEFKTASQDRVLRHVVLLDLNEQASDSVIYNMKEDLQDLKSNISQIRDLEFGANIQPDADYSHCMLLTFESVEDLKAYEEHLMHLEFASTYGKYVIKKTEVDYWY